MSSIASILRHAEFVERLEARSGETLFWNPATGLKVALGSIDRTDRDTLASFGWIATEPKETTSILALLRLRWPKLESLHPDHLGRHLTAISATEALEAVPEQERGRVARWLIARGRAMGIPGMAEAILDSGVAIRSAASAAPTMDNPTRYFIGADGRFAYSTSGNEVDGYKLVAHDAQGSGFTSREDVSFEALLTPSSEWSPLDWESAAALATATEVDQNTFASHPSLTSSSGILHRLAERSPDAVAQLASVEKGGLRYLLGEHHQQLRSRFLDAPRPAWINQICDQHNLATSAGWSMRGSRCAQRMKRRRSSSFQQSGILAQSWLPGMMSACWACSGNPLPKSSPTPAEAKDSSRNPWPCVVKRQQRPTFSLIASGPSSTLTTVPRWSPPWKKPDASTSSNPPTTCQPLSVLYIAPRTWTSSAVFQSMAKSP